MRLPTVARTGPFDTREVQGDVAPGFKKDHRWFLLVRVDDLDPARVFLALLDQRVATCDDVATFNQLWRDLRERGGGVDPPLAATWLNIAICRSGLDKLKV